MTHTHDCKSGQKFRVTGLPPHSHYRSPHRATSEAHWLQDGDVLESDEPPLYKGTGGTMFLRYNSCYIIPLEFIEPIDDRCPTSINKHHWIMSMSAIVGERDGDRTPPATKIIVRCGQCGVLGEAWLADDAIRWTREEIL